jgi:predicted Fe-Mo cluster-binding NifX family protein
MRIVVSSQGENLNAAASPIFGRCPTYVFVDTETMAFQAVPNPAMNQGGGAGIQAAQFVVNQGAEAVLSGNLGPNAFDVLQAAGVPGYLIVEGTVSQAVEAYRGGRLQPMAGPNGAAHAGMGRGMRPGRDASRDTELAELGETLKSLRQQLAETMARIEELGMEE